jgi:hypothetical protein
MSPVGFADLRIRDLSQRITGHSDLVLFHFVRNTVTGSAGVLHVTLDDDDDVVGVDEDPMMRSAPLGMVSGAVVGVLAVLSSG